MNRYNRHIILSDVGQEGQEKLLQAKVLVVGAGGLGCPVLQYLTAVGIGTLGIIDFDVVEESNLQRQVLFGTSSLGTNKAIAAKNRLEDLNPTITINTYPEKLTAKNALELFKDEECQFHLLNTYTPLIFQLEYTTAGGVNYELVDTMKNSSEKGLKKLMI